jgi:hypothetical protein
MKTVPIKISNVKGVLNIDTPDKTLSATYDNESHSFEFERPEGYATHELLLILDSGGKTKQTQNLGVANSYPIPAHFTKYTKLRIQVLFRSNETKLEYSNVLDFTLKSSLLDYVNSGDGIGEEFETSGVTEMTAAEVTAAWNAT